MKKTIAIIITALALIIGLVCCDPKPTQPTQTAESIVTTESDTYPVSEIVTDDVSETEETVPVDSEIETEAVSTETETSAVTSDYAEETVMIEDTDEVDERGF